MVCAYDFLKHPKVLYGPGLLTQVGIYHGHWFRNLRYGPLRSLKVEMG